MSTCAFHHEQGEYLVPLPHPFIHRIDCELSELKSHAKAYLRSEQVQGDPLWAESKRRTEIVSMSRGVIMQSTLPRLVVRGIRHLAGTWPTGNGSLALCVRLFFLYKTKVPRGPLASDVAPLLFCGILLRTANRYVSWKWQLVFWFRCEGDSLK